MIKMSKNDLCWQIFLGAIHNGFLDRWEEEIQLKRTYTDKGGVGLTKCECPPFIIKYFSLLNIQQLNVQHAKSSRKQ